MARRKSLYIKLSRRRIKTILNLKDKQELSEEEETIQCKEHGLFKRLERLIYKAYEGAGRGGQETK